MSKLGRPENVDELAIYLYCVFCTRFSCSPPVVECDVEEDFKDEDNFTI